MGDTISTNQMVQQIQQKQAQKTKGVPVNPLLSSSDRGPKSDLQTLTLSKRETPMAALYDRLSDGTYIAKYENYLGAEGNEDRLARQQSTGSQWGNGLLKAGVKTLNYAADSLIGTIYGAAQAIGTGDVTKLYDNELADFFDDANKRLDNNLHNYYTDDQKAMGLLESMGTANFWANDVTGALAFVGGAVLSNAAMATLTGGATLGTSAAKLSMQLGKSLVKEGAEATGKQLAKKFATGIAAKSFGDKVGTGAFLFRTANFEAGMEARQNLKESTDHYYDKFQKENGRMPTYEESTAFLKDASSAANGVYAANLAILSVSNAVMFGKKILPSSFTDKISGFGDRLVGMGTKKTVVDGITSTTLRTAELNKAQKIWGNAVKISKKPLTEGLYEEGFQGVAGKTMQNYLDAKYSDNNLEGLSVTSAMYDAFAEQYGSKEGWKEMGIGMIIGLAGGVVQPGKAKDKFEGFGSQSFATERTRKAVDLERANKGIEVLAGLNRVSAATGMATRSQAELGGSYNTAQDTAESFAFISSQEHIKNDAEILEDYNTTIDAMDFDKNNEIKPILQEAGLSASEYKEVLKKNFSDHLEDFNFAKKAVSALGLQDIKDSAGNVIEFAEAHTYNIMAGKNAMRNAQEIGKQLDNLIGTSGLYDYYQHYENLSKEDQAKSTELLSKKAELKKLQDGAVKISQKLSGISVKGVRATKPETLDKKRNTLSEQSVFTQERIITLNQEIEDITKALTQQAETAAFDGTGYLRRMSSVVSPMEAIEAIDKVDGFVESLKTSGRTAEAKRLEQVIQEFKAFNFAHREMNNFHTKMMASNFFSTKEGKGIFSRMVGKKYETSPEFLKLIEDNNDIVDRSLKIAGVGRYGDFKKQWEAISASEDLSDREKYKLEAIIRMNLASWAMQNVAENLTEASEEIAPREDRTPTKKGDTLRTKTSLEDKNLNNLDTLNTLIKAVTDEIDYVKNYNTKNHAEVVKLKDKLSKLLLKKQALEESLLEGEVVVQSDEVFSAPEQNTTVNTESSDIIDSIIENKDVIDKMIEDRLAKYGLPIYDVLNSLTESLERVIWRAKVGKPVDTITLTEAIDTLYNIYKDLTRLKNPENSQERLDKSLTLEYINAAQQEIEQELIYLIDYETSLKTGEAIPTFEYTSKTPATTIETSTETGTSTRNDAESQTAEQIVEDKNSKRAKTPLTELEKLNKQIEALQQQIDNLSKDFRIMESEDFKRYTALLKKKEKGTIKPKEENELESLREDIDQWTFLTGVVVDGFRLSDLISQKAVLENAQIADTNPVSVPVTEETLDDVEIADVTGNANYALLQVYDKVILGRNGDNLIVHNITKEEFEDLLGTTEITYIADTSGKGNIIISLDEARRLETISDIRFAAPTKGTARVGSMIKIIPADKSNTGNETYEAVNSDYGKELNDKQGHNIEAVFASEAGDTLNLYIDLTNSYNTELIDELAAAYRLVKNKPKATKEDLQRLADAKKAVAENISMLALNKGEAVGTIKGIRNVTKNDKNDTILEALRMSIIENEALLQELVKPGASGMIEVKVENNAGEFVAPKITVQAVLPGVPNLNYAVDESGKVVAESGPMIESQINKVVTIGYVQGGKTFTQDRQGADTIFLRSAEKRAGNMKVPFIVLNVGGKRIAYPVTVGTVEREYEEQFRALYNATGLTNTERANNLNKFLASQGIDIKVEGNAFIAFGNSNLNDTFFDEKLAQLKGINYFYSVDEWIDPATDMKEVLKNQVSVDINVNEPFHSPKIKMDFSEVDVKRASDAAVAKAKTAAIKTSKKVQSVNATNVTSVLFGKKCK
jgi:hypothetical protein